MADFTIADVLAWARTKPAGETYCYETSGGCAVAMFLNETGRATQAGVGPNYWHDFGADHWSTIHDFPLGLEDAVLARGVFDKKAARTFGELVKRLEAVEPETPVTKAGWAAIDAYLTDIDAVSADKLAPAHIQPHTV